MPKSRLRTWRDKIKIRAIHGFEQAIVDKLEPTLDLPVCRTIIQGRRIVALDDLRGADNTADNSFLEALGAQSYLGAPVFDPADTAVGTLCVLGTTARIWSERQKEQIVDLASLITERITLRATLATVRLLSERN